MPGKVIEKDRGWKDLLKRMQEMKGIYAKVGIITDTQKGAAAHDSGGDLTVAELAAIHEFGTKDGHVTERSFLRSTFNEKRTELQLMATNLVGQIIAGDMRANRACGLMGAKFAADVKKKITVDGVPPANAPSTIAAKGSDRPLVDTSRMVNAISYVVVDSKFKEALDVAEGGVAIND